VGKVHQSGICHNDFHPGNLLLPIDGNRPLVDRQTGRYRLHLIDVPGVRFSKPLLWPAVRASFVVLNAAWGRRLSRSDRYRFWKAYLTARPDLKVPPLPRVVCQVEKRTEAHCQRRLQRRDRRTLRTSHDFVALRTSVGRSHGVSQMPRSAMHELSTAPETLLWENMHRPVKLDRGSLIVEADLPLGDRTIHVAYKRYRPRKWWKLLLAPLRPARAVQGWQRGHALQLRGIPAARPVIAVDRRRPWFRCESYLAVQWIEDSENLHLYLWRMARETQQVRMRQANRCADSIGRLLGRMHAQRVLHGDLKGSNLLVTDRDGRIESYLVDFDQVCLNIDTSLLHRAADLARLAASLDAHPWVSRTVRVRFLRAYLKAAGQNSADWKQLWLTVSERSRRINRRKRRKGQTIL
jgi:tRNA A-37 threonylcarbamoyl transferase component Bud32